MAVTFNLKERQIQ